MQCSNSGNGGMHQKLVDDARLDWPFANICRTKFECMVHLLFAKTKGGAVALWLVYLPLDEMVWVQALARLIMLCSQTRHLALTVSLHPGI